MHQVRLNEALVERLTAQRGGKLNLYDRLDPARTAHLIIDMQNGFMAAGAPVEVPMAREIVPQVNAIAAAVREAGGTNIFVQFTTPAEALEGWSSFYGRFPEADRKAHQEAFAREAPMWRLWPSLGVTSDDLTVEKGRFSAFTHGTSDLDMILRQRGIDTLIITGTLSNCCCESTARDAMQLNYKVVFVSDANATTSDEEHNGTLNNMCALFADVMATHEVVAALQAG